MRVLTYRDFLKSLPTVVLPLLRPAFKLKTRQPFQWIIQFYDDDPTLHYEVQRIARRDQFELGLHFENRNKALNNALLTGFSRHLIEIRDQLGDQIEAEMWDRGWAKVYELYPADKLTPDYQHALAQRLATIIRCLHPILYDLQSHRTGKSLLKKRASA